MQCFKYFTELTLVGDKIHSCKQKCSRGFDINEINNLDDLSLVQPECYDCRKHTNNIIYSDCLSFENTLNLRIVPHNIISDEQIEQKQFFLTDINFCKNFKNKFLSELESVNTIQIDDCDFFIYTEHITDLLKIFSDLNIKKIQLKTNLYYFDITYLDKITKMFSDVDIIYSNNIQNTLKSIDELVKKYNIIKEYDNVNFNTLITTFDNELNDINTIKDIMYIYNKFENNNLIIESNSHIKLIHICFLSYFDKYVNITYEQIYYNFINQHIKRDIKREQWYLDKLCGISENKILIFKDGTVVKCYHDLPIPRRNVQNTCNFICNLNNEQCGNIEEIKVLYYRKDDLIVNINAINNSILQLCTLYPKIKNITIINENNIKNNFSFIKENLQFMSNNKLNISINLCVKNYEDFLYFYNEINNLNDLKYCKINLTYVSTYVPTDIKISNKKNNIHIIFAFNANDKNIQQLIKLLDYEKNIDYIKIHIDPSIEFADILKKLKIKTQLNNSLLTLNKNSKLYKAIYDFLCENNLKNKIVKYKQINKN